MYIPKNAEINSYIQKKSRKITSKKQIRFPMPIYLGTKREKINALIYTWNKNRMKRGNGQREGKKRAGLPTDNRMWIL